MTETKGMQLVQVLLSTHPAGSDPRQAQKYECWARSQIRYMIGDSGRSYVVGFGSTPPGSEHHRGASCPAESSLGSNNPVCDYGDYALPTPNPNTLYGALVGGAPCRLIFQRLIHAYRLFACRPA